MRSLTINASGDLMVPNLQCQEVVTATVNASGDMVIKGSCQEAVLRDNASGDLSADDLKAVKSMRLYMVRAICLAVPLVPLRRKRMAAEVSAIPVTPLR